MPVDKFTSQTSYFAYIYNQKVLTMKRIGLAILIFHFSGTLIFAQNIQWQWAKALHTPDVERATAVVSDPNSGEIYLACQWRGTLTAIFPAGTTESTDFAATYGGVDGMVVKYDSEGNDRITDIHVDESGHFYIAGHFKGAFLDYRDMKISSGERRIRSFHEGDSGSCWLKYTRSPYRIRKSALRKGSMSGWMGVSRSMISP